MLNQRLPAFCRDGSIRHRSRAEDPDEFNIRLIRHRFNESADFVLTASKRIDDSLAGREQVRTEMFERCWLVEKGIAFVKQSNDADAFHGKCLMRRFEAADFWRETTSCGSDLFEARIEAICRRE